jgi:phosphoribosylformimino-5-aminoimidazole carboxamide ribotide isomerase
MITIIPAIDIIGGKCVRLSKGNYEQKIIYNENPVEVAKQFEDAGLKRLHLVDLDGAKAGKVVNQKVLEKIATATNLLIDFGGGIKSTEELRSVMDAGAHYISIGSMAVKNSAIFDSWIQQYGAEKFFLGADVREGKIAVQGWLEQTEIEVVGFIQQQMKKRISHVFCTDISRDGLLEGPSFDLYRHLLAQCPGLRLTASGGVASVHDIRQLDELGCDGVIVGKAIYENRISLKELLELNG